MDDEPGDVEAGLDRVGSDRLVYGAVIIVSVGGEGELVDGRPVVVGIGRVRDFLLLFAKRDFDDRADVDVGVHGEAEVGPFIGVGCLEQDVELVLVVDAADVDGLALVVLHEIDGTVAVAVNGSDPNVGVLLGGFGQDAALQGEGGLVRDGGGKRGGGVGREGQAVFAVDFLDDHALGAAPAGLAVQLAFLKVGGLEVGAVVPSADREGDEAGHSAGEVGVDAAVGVDVAGVEEAVLEAFSGDREGQVFLGFKVLRGSRDGHVIGVVKHGHRGGALVAAVVNDGAGVGVAVGDRHAVGQDGFRIGGAVDQRDLQVVDAEVGDAPAVDVEVADLLAALFLGELLEVVGHAVDPDGLHGHDARSGVNEEAVVAPFALGEGAGGQLHEGAVQTVQVDNVVAVAEFVDGVDHEAVPEAVAHLAIEAVGLGAAAELDHVLVGVGRGIGDRHVQGVFRDAEILGNVGVDEVVCAAGPTGVLFHDRLAGGVHFEVVAVEDVAAGDAEAVFALAAFAGINAEGAAVVFLAHFGAVEDELHFGAAFAGAFAALDGAPVVVIRQGHVVVEGSAAAVDDLDDGLIVLEADVAVVFHVQFGLSFFFHQFDLEVVDVDVGISPAPEEEGGPESALAGIAVILGNVEFIGHAVDGHGSQAVRARGDVHDEAVVGPLLQREVASGVAVIDRPETVAVDDVAFAGGRMDGVKAESPGKAVPDLGFLEDLHAAGELHVVVGRIRRGVRDGIVRDGLERVAFRSVEAHAEVAVVLGHIVRAGALPEGVLAGHGLAGG